MRNHHAQTPWTDIADSSDEASGTIRIKTPAGWVDATEQDIKLMLMAPELLAVIREAELVLAEKLKRLGADNPNASPTYQKMIAIIEKATA